MTCSDFADTELLFMSAFFRPIIPASFMIFILSRAMSVSRLAESSILKYSSMSAIGTLPPISFGNTSTDVMCFFMSEAVR